MRPSWLCKWRSKVKPLFVLYISATTGPIEPKFCMHMQCDQQIILHNNNKLTWGHLGYANEGQRSNLMNFVLKISQKRNEQSSSNFHSIFALMRNGYNNLFSLITQPWRHLDAILITKKTHKWFCTQNDTQVYQYISTHTHTCTDTYTHIFLCCFM